LQAALAAVTLQCRPSLHVGLRVVGSDARTTDLAATGSSRLVAAIPAPCFLQIRAMTPAMGSEPASSAPVRTAAGATAVLLLSMAHLRGSAFDLPSLLAHGIAHALLPRVAEVATGRTAGAAAVASRASVAPSARSKGVSSALCAPLAALLRETLPPSLQVLPALSPLPGSTGRSPAAWNPFADADVAEVAASEPLSDLVAGRVEAAVSRTLVAFKLPADVESGSTDENSRGAAADRARGTLGRALHPIDAAAAQLAPTRSFLVGELLAVEVAADLHPAAGAAQERAGAAEAATGPSAVPHILVYGRVEAAAPLSFGVGSLLSVRTRADAAEDCVAPAVASTGRTARRISLVQLRSTRVRAIQPSAAVALVSPAGELLLQASSGVAPPAEASARMPGAASPGGAGSSRATAVASSAGQPLTAAATESAAVLAALRDMLTRLGGAGTADALLVGGGGGQGALAEMLALRRRLADAEGAQAALAAEVAAARAEIEAAKEAATCAICYTNPVDCVLAPCGHQICRSCERQLTSGRCPFDRRVVQLAVPVFKPR
jgi:hypothetical protein